MVALLALGSFGLTLIALADSTVGKVLGVAVAVVGVAFAALTARATGTIRLDPDGVTLPAGITPPGTLRGVTWLRSRSPEVGSRPW